MEFTPPTATKPIELTGLKVTSPMAFTTATAIMPMAFQKSHSRAANGIVAHRHQPDVKAPPLSYFRHFKLLPTRPKNLGFTVH